MAEEIAPGIYRDETDASLTERMDRNWHRLLRGSFIAFVFLTIDRQFDFWLWGMIWGGAAGHALGSWWTLRSLARERSRLRRS